MKLIDSHCHLDFPDFEKDFDEMLMRANSSGVAKFINPGVDIMSSKRAVALAESHENIFAAVGFHPSEAEKMSANNFFMLEKIARSKKVVAIGEIGLDFFRNQNSSKIQIEVFRKQLALAEELNLPVIIHSREADSEIFKILNEFEVQGFFHCFGGSWSFAEKILAHGFFIGLTGIVTFPNAKNVREVAKKIPLERLLVETDSPFLAPQKFRGKRCEPAFIFEIVTTITKIRGVEFEKVAEQTSKNAEELFGI